MRKDLEAQAAVEPGTPIVWNEFAVTLKDGGACIGNISFKRTEPEEAPWSGPRGLPGKVF